MAFIDEMNFHAKAGDGGNGVVAWRHEKGRDFGGPAGGNGGRGGDVYVRGVRDYGILAKYRNIKVFEARRGQDGAGMSKWGENSEPFVIDVPLGSVITNLSTGQKFEVLKEGELIFLLKGGKGGFGNQYFKGSKNVTPQQSTLGKPGEEADFFLEIQLLVDAGFVGFPNAGKSSLLNELTNASAKVAPYQFTTLEPNLGDLYGYILADIPGLIEGASQGKGLGFKFLRHINRTKLILHCVSLEEEKVTSAYKVVRKELETYSSELAAKPEVIILTKTDLVAPAVLKKRIAEIKKLNKKVYSVSILDEKSLKKLKDDLVKILKKQTEKEEKAAVAGASGVKFESKSIPTAGLEKRAERTAKKLKKK